MSLFVEIYSQGKVHALFVGIADFLAPTKSDAFFLGTFPSTRSGQRKISKKSDDFFLFWSLFFTIRSGLRARLIKILKIQGKKIQDTPPYDTL